MGQSEHYYLGRRNFLYDDKIHWEPLDGKTFRVTKPTVICLGGNGSLKTRNANFCCKVAQSLVGIKEPRFANEIATTEDVDFIGIGYGKNYNDSEDGTGSLTKHEAIELAKSIFEPFYLDEKGRIRPEAEILRNFNQVTFFAHCHGAREVTNLILYTTRNMLDIGIARKTVDAAIGQIFAVSYAPIVTMPCPNLQVITERDGMLFGAPLFSNLANQFLDNRHKQESESKGTVVFKEDANTISLIVTNMTQHKEVEHPIVNIQRDNRWQMQETDTAYGDVVSQAMGVVLSYAIANSLKNQHSSTWTPRPTIDFMLKKVQSILGETQNPVFAQQIATIQDNNIQR